MNFVKDLEECLRDLAAASRNKHPGVKEASERAVMKLRSLQAKYVAAVRTHTATTAVFRSSDLLHPFLLAANYPNADYKLLEISFRALRLLMEAEAIVPSDGLHMVRVYQIQAQVVTAYYHKLYAKEISMAQQQQQQQAKDEIVEETTSSEQNEGGNSQHSRADMTETGATSVVPTVATTSSSWFSWGSSSSSTTNHSDSKVISTSDSSHKLKNAVSSSTGQTGQASFSGARMEKLALEILSSLLQLLQLLRHDGTSLELWTNAVALSCLWFFLPVRHTVRQAAHTTLRQILSLLFTASSQNNSYNSNNNKLFLHATWEDLLTLTECSSTDTTTITRGRSKILHGAFRLCREQSTRGNDNSAMSPPPELALELMTQIWKQEMINNENDNNSTDHTSRIQPPTQHACFTDSLILKSMGVSVNLLSQTRSIEKTMRILQWTMVLYQSCAASYANECRELLGQLLRSIAAATDAARQHHDFEDGYVYTSQQDSKNSNDNDNDDTIHLIRSNDIHRRPVVTATVFPSAVLWKAGFVLETVYHILDSEDMTALLEDRSTVQCLAETLSDFCTIGTSCRMHIEEVVGFCRRQHKTSSSVSVKPTIFRKALSLLATGDLNGCDGSSKRISSSSSSNAISHKNVDQQQRQSTQILGECMWLALQGILRLGECTRNMTNESDREDLLQEIFSPSLAALQHIMKRICGSHEMVRLALSGYATLADTSLPLKKCAVENKVLLNSLSKLSLPSWGRHDAFCYLQDHHIRLLLCLLRIIHRHYDFLAEEWEIVLWTFEQLSILDTASPLLSDDSYSAGLNVAASFERFPGFSTCFSDASLAQMTQALSEICIATVGKRDVVGASDTVLPDRASAVPQVFSNNRSSSGEQESISDKIMSLGVRALYGTGSADSDIVTESEQPPRLERTKKNFDQDYWESFVRRIANSNHSTRMTSIGRLPFVLMLLSDVALSNTFRGKDFGDQISAEFSRLADTSPAIRPFVMDMTTMLLLSRLGSGKIMALTFEGRGKVVFDDPMQSQLLAVEVLETVDSATSNRNLSQAEVLAPLCETLLNIEKADVAKASLEVLTTILEGTGQTLQGEVWLLIIDAIASLSGNSKYKLDRSSAVWAPCCLLAFSTLKLIVDDFLDALPSSTGSNESVYISLLDCCSSFVGSRHDINTSLTAIGLLWTIADQESDTDSTDRALSELALLSSDVRPEVRNAAVNTLFSCIVGRGGGFSTAYWESCITSTVFGVFDIVSAKAGAGSVIANEKGFESNERVIANASRQSRYKLSRHHSRDSTGKMWVATQVLVLRGLIRVLRIFFAQLLDTMDRESWFHSAWNRILDFGFDAASQDSSRENIDIRSVGIELLVVCCQLASKAGIQAALNPARVSTNMEVVNGALRSVRDPHAQSTPKITYAYSEVTEIARQHLFLGSFESIEAFDREVLQNSREQDDSDWQILSRFCALLGKLYECCRKEEFLSNHSIRSLRSLTNEAKESDENDESDHLECRFVQIVVSIMNLSSGDTSARFLNQGQRGSLDLLRSMAADGSSFAFESLIHIAGLAFIVRKDDSDEDYHHGDGKLLTPTLLNLEAAVVVSQEISNENVSDEVRAYVLYLVLKKGFSEMQKQRRYYKNIVPVVQSGLQSTAHLAEQRGNEESIKAATIVCNQMNEFLVHVLTPVPINKSTSKISRVAEILIMISSAVENAVAIGLACDLSAILVTGADAAFDAAKQHAIHAETCTPESDLGRKSKKQRDDLINLFQGCFAGSCTLDLQGPKLRCTVEAVFHGALDDTDETIQALCVEASLLVCETILIQKMSDKYRGTSDVETFVISIISCVCRLVVSNKEDLRNAAGKMLTNLQIGETIQTVQKECEFAEARAQQAETRVAELEELVEQLQWEKQERERSRKGLWGL